MIELPDTEDEQWDEVYGELYSGLTKEEKKSLTAELDGPLQVAAMLDPLAILCNKQIAHSSPCMEEGIVVRLPVLRAQIGPYNESSTQASKAIGSHREERIKTLNTCLWDLMVNVALGVLPMTEVAFELQEIMSDKAFTAALNEHRHFYGPRGVEVTVEGEKGPEKKTGECSA